MNIGLEVLNAGATAAVPSIECVFLQYASCEVAFENTAKFTAYGDQLLTTFDNLASLHATASKFQSTEAMAVLNDLVRNDFHGSLSVEAIGEAGKSVWQRIKDFFKKIWEWIKYFFNRILNFFFSAEKRLGKLAAEIRNIKSKKIKPWIMPIATPEEVIKHLKAVVGDSEKEIGKIKTAFMKQDAKSVIADLTASKSIIEKIIEEGKKIKFDGEVTIDSKDVSLLIVVGLAGVIAIAKGLKESMSSVTKAAEGFSDNLRTKSEEGTATKTEVEGARAATDVLKSATKLVGEVCKATSRIAAVVLTRCKAVEPTKEDSKTKKK